MEEERPPPGDYGDQYDDQQQLGEYMEQGRQQYREEGQQQEYDAEPSAPPQEDEQPLPESPLTEDRNVVSLLGSSNVHPNLVICAISVIAVSCISKLYDLNWHAHYHWRI